MNLQNISKYLMGVGSTIFAGSIILGNCFFVNDPGERAIIFNKLSGMKQVIKGEGINYKLPIIEEVIKYDVRMNPFNFYTFSATKDLQKVQLKIKVLYHPLEKFLPKIYLDYNKDYANKLFPLFGNEVLKQVIANYDAEQLLKQREKISNEIKVKMISKAKEFHIVLDEVMVNEITFTPEFLRSIERKQVEQQEVERQKYIVMMNEEEKKASIIKAEGESDAALIVANATKKYGSGYIELQKLDATKDIIRNVSSNPNITYIPESGNYLFQMPTL